MNTIDRVAADLQVLAQGMIVKILQPETGKVKVVNTPVKFSRTVCRVEGACPQLGEHVEEILTSLFGMRRDDLNKLREQCII